MWRGLSARAKFSRMTEMKPLAILTFAVALTAGAVRANEVLPFIEDDYPKAVARAKTKNVPIFVEAWAPW